MKKLMKRLTGRRSGQTTAEYGIIVALIAIASISIILIFGNQIRELFFKEAQQLAGDADARVDDHTTGGDPARDSLTDW